MWLRYQARRLYEKTVDRYPEVMRISPLNNGWNTIAISEKGRILEREGTTLFLKTPYWRVLFLESRAWERVYLPGFSLEGKVVLDVGAGCGETAELFFRHGARKVIAIEANPDLKGYLGYNSFMNRWQMDVRMEPFSLEHMDLEFDFMKVDCEGGELQLLDWKGKVPACRIEVHPDLYRNGEDDSKKLISHLGLRLVSGNIYGTD